MNKNIFKSLDILNLSSDTLTKQLISCKKELLNLRFNKKLGELKDLSLFKKNRRMVARINTELSKRNRIGEN